MIFVFDVFGTLIRPNPNRVNPYRRIFDKGIPANVMTRDISLPDLVNEMGLNAELPVIEAEAQGDLNRYACYSDTLPTLQRLQDEGHRVAVCTNLSPLYGELVYALLPSRLIEAYVFSYKVGALKPDPMIYRAVCDALQCLPADITFIGDSMKCDVDGPRNVGMQSRHLNRAAGQLLRDIL